MVQDQLTDYISSQMKLGVSREAIKMALVDAGWVAGDVEDTLKKNEGGTTTAQPAAPAMGMGAMAGAASVAASAKPATAAVQPQMLRVSDLVSSSAAMAPVSSPSSAMGIAVAKSAGANAASATGSATMKSDPKMVDMSKLGGTISGNSFQANAMGGSSVKKSAGLGVWAVVGGIVIVVLAGAAFYFYSQEAGLSAKVATVTAQASSVSAQLAALNAQVGASSTGMQAQITSLTAANADLSLELSFFGVTPGTTPTTTPATISGQLSGGPRIPYAITTPRGAKIYILNYTNAQVLASMTPLIGQAVQAVGTYVPGSDEITVTSLTALN